MSPEERAEAWLKVVLTERRQCRSLTTIRSLASQFRAAEDEALERAAILVDALQADSRVQPRELARQVRMLKSKPSEGT